MKKFTKNVSLRANETLQLDNFVPRQICPPGHFRNCGPSQEVRATQQQPGLQLNYNPLVVNFTCATQNNNAVEFQSKPGWRWSISGFQQEHFLVFERVELHFGVASSPANDSWCVPDKVQPQLTSFEKRDGPRWVSLDRSSSHTHTSMLCCCTTWPQAAMVSSRVECGKWFLCRPHQIDSVGL